MPGKVWRTTIVSSSGATNVSATRVTLPNTLVVIDRATSGSNVWLQRSGVPQRFPSTETLSAKRPKLNASTWIPCGERNPGPPNRLPTMKMPRVMSRLRFLAVSSDGTPPRKSAVMQRLPFDSITGTYPVGSSAPMPHTVRPPVTRISRGAGMIVAVLGMAEVVIPFRVSYRLPPTSRSAFTISGYGVSQMSVSPTEMYSPSKRPDVASSENWCQWQPTTCGMESASRT